MSKIGIIGFGFVGQAVYSAIREKNNVVIYDKYKNIGTLNKMLNTAALFICVPTPTEAAHQNPTEIIEVLEALTGKYKGLVVVKSTVLASVLNHWDLKLVYNPEFLNQNTAIEDFKKQKVIILGGRIDYTMQAEELYSEYVCVRCNDFEHCSIEEAFNIKYLHNIYHAYKCLFWNYANEVTGNSRKVSRIYKKITDRNEMDRISADGKPGFGGACFPKDVVAYDEDKPHMLTQFIINYNHKLRPKEMREVS